MMLQSLQQADMALGATTSTSNIQKLPQMPELQLNSHGAEAVKKSSLTEVVPYLSIKQMFLDY